MSLNINTIKKYLFFLFLLSFSFPSLSLTQELFDKKIKEIEFAFNNKDKQYIGKVIDWDIILKTSFKDIHTTESFKEGFTTSFKKQGAESIGELLLRNVQAGSKIKLIKKTLKNQYAKATFRFNYGDNGFGYIRFILQGDDNKPIKIVDWFDYARGQYYTDSVASIIRSTAPTPGLMGKVKRLISGENKAAQLLLEISRLMKKNEYHELGNIFQRSQETLKDHWTLTSTMLFASNLSGNEELYKKVLEFTSKHFSDDERAGFLLIDYYFYNKDFNKAIAVLDHLSATFNHQDAGILFLKSNTYIELKAWDKAKETARECIDIEKDFEDCYWNIVSMEITEGNYAAAIRQLEELKTNFNYQFSSSDFENSEFYQDFILSEDYKKWIN